MYTGTLVWGAKAKDNAEPVRVEKAFPAIITKAQFNRVGKLMRARAPKRSHPRRVGSTYLLSGLVKCKACGRALSGQDAKSGQFSYYVCQSIMKRCKNACVTPRLNARRFEQMIVDKIRSNILTEGSITELVRAVDEEMDGIASEQRKRLETIDTELEDVKRRLGRIWNAIETSDIDIADASDRIKEHRERKERLEDAAADARAVPARSCAMALTRRSHSRGRSMTSKTGAMGDAPIRTTPTRTAKKANGSAVCSFSQRMAERCASWRRSCALDRLSAGIGLNRSCDASIGRAPQRRGSSTGLALSHSCHRDDRGMPS